MTLTITSNFDAGNIRVLGSTHNSADLEIVSDHMSDFYQWFYFKVAGGVGQKLTLRITNCLESAFPGGWANYQARVSEDDDSWFQTRCDYNQSDGVLTIYAEPKGDNFSVAYFAPYSTLRHAALIETMAAKPGVTRTLLCNTLDGRPLESLTLGTGPKQIWIYARQHPGETMAEWFAEGALEKLTDPKDAVAKLLREKATFTIVPNMNPDGSARGHLRTNAVGVNLNREWHAPSEDQSPEVLHVLKAMDATGVDFALDVHGDEAIPAVFVAGFEGIPSWSAAKGDLYTRYQYALAERTPDFQTKLGYGVASAGKANLSMSTPQLAERFGAVAFTLEMPFKDNHEAPDAVYGWSPERSKKLAHDCLDVLAEMIDDI